MTVQLESGPAAVGNPLPWGQLPPSPPKARFVEADQNSVAIARTLQMVALVLLVLLFNLVVVSQVQHYAWQTSLYGDLRLSLAQGSVPTGPADAGGQPITPGTPLAVLQGASSGLGDEVIIEGTSSAQTMQGIGHLRSTGLPCQVGTSVLMARSGAYGGTGAGWAALEPGQQFSVTMGQGSCTYEVMDRRLAGDPSPPLPVNREGRLILTTASGLPFMPDGVIRVDAKLVTDAFDRPAIALPDASLPVAERAMAVDDTGVFGLVLLLEVLVAAAIGVTWLWKRWGRWEAWIVGVPVLGVLALLVGTNVSYLLPNLL